jgi:hypothetical protein
MNDLIAALQRAARSIEAADGNPPWPHEVTPDDARTIRAHIADLKAGGERAKVVAWHERKALTCEFNAGDMEKAGEDYAAHDFRTMGGTHSSCALAIASGAHMENNNAD